MTFALVALESYNLMIIADTEEELLNKFAAMETREGVDSQFHQNKNLGQW